MLELTTFQGDLDAEGDGADGFDGDAQLLDFWRSFNLDPIYPFCDQHRPDHHNHDQGSNETRLGRGG